MRSHLDLLDNYAAQNESSQFADGFRPQFEGVSHWLNYSVKAIAHALIGVQIHLFGRRFNTWWIIDEMIPLRELAFMPYLKKKSVPGLISITMLNPSLLKAPLVMSIHF